MEKAKKMPMLLCVCLLLTVVALILVSGTYAKYTTSLSGSDEATVAKWSWKINDTDLKDFTQSGVAGATQDFTINLFNTIKDSDYTSDESNVKTGLIAPGTSGQLTFKIENYSDVDGEISIEFEETANTGNIPIEYTTDTTGTWYDAEHFVIPNANSTIAKNNGDGAKNITVYWRWAYEQDHNDPDEGDEVDTAAGFAAAAAVAADPESPLKVEVSAKLTLTQVD